ncbi:hypothetical protein [Maribacter halichondriae]|uniref:hypothetical protein n=1 Tax=Maribacter halichondriae TaxID=2980554 RepID=UPI002358D5F0|nr:hypothetical protein [Maribacter sp. Hal144]
MKKIYLIICLLAFCIFSSFAMTKACEYASSNLGFVQTQTEKAIDENDLNKVRFFTYKALNAIEKTKKELTECGCEDANELIEEGKENLKRTVKTSTLTDAKRLLRSSLQNILDGLSALEDHEQHVSKYPTDVLAMNTTETRNTEAFSKIPTEDELHRKIDASLIDYQFSLDNIVETVDCKEALEFATRVYNNCETELLKPNLSEGKKYYNLRTKEITAEALERLKNCSK